VSKKSPTFCPAKWAELIINPIQKKSYGCCKAIESTYVSDPKKHIYKEQENLLNGIKDKSCEACWQIEERGHQSLRQDYFNVYPHITEDNCNESQLEQLEINVGNVCNFNCAYCGPRFSTAWQSDIKQNGEYSLAISNHEYSQKKPGLLAETEISDLIKKYNPKSVLLIGGEPLIIPSVINAPANTDLYPDTIFKIITNLSDQTMPTIRSLYDNTNAIKLTVSLDCTGDLAEFIRGGLIFDNIVNNIVEVLERSSIHLTIMALINNVTLYDLDKFIFMLDNLPHSDRISVYFNTVATPEIHSFNAIPEDIKEKHLKKLDRIAEKNIHFINFKYIASAIRVSKYNEALHRELVDFYSQYAHRNNKDITKLPSEVQEFITCKFDNNSADAILCIGNNTDSTDDYASAIANEYGLINCGLFDSAGDVTANVYHTSIADTPVNKLFNYIHKFKDIIILDQAVTDDPIDIAMHHTLMTLGPIITRRYNIPHRIIKI